MLTWARKRNKLTIEMLAERMKRTPTEIKMWEDGTKDPSYGHLEDLAYKQFKIPLAVLFFPEPPAESDPVNKFRHLPDYELERFSEDTVRKIRLAQAYQDSLSIILEDYTSKKIFNDIVPKNQSVKDLAHQVRKYVGITIEEQYKFSSCENAFKRWRYALEKCGIFTFKDFFKDRFISGFCLIDDNFPIIFVNNSNAFSRQIFTLMHELTHILFKIDGVTDVDDSYLSFMNKTEKDTEIFCNKFASCLLVPDDNFDRDIAFYEKNGMDSISEIADHYSVSREVILRRLLDHGIVSDDLYCEKAYEWNRDYLRSSKRQKGGNYYLTQLAYLGEGYTKSSFEQYRRGHINKADLANYLNVKAKNLDNLESQLRW